MKIFSVDLYLNIQSRIRPHIFPPLLPLAVWGFVRCSVCVSVQGKVWFGSRFCSRYRVLFGFVCGLKQDEIMRNNLSIKPN